MAMESSMVVGSLNPDSVDKLSRALFQLTSRGFAIRDLTIIVDQIEDEHEILSYLHGGFHLVQGYDPTDTQIKTWFWNACEDSEIAEHIQDMEREGWILRLSKDVWLTDDSKAVVHIFSRPIKIRRVAPLQGLPQS